MRWSSRASTDAAASQLCPASSRSRVGLPILLPDVRLRRVLDTPTHPSRRGFQLKMYTCCSDSSVTRGRLSSTLSRDDLPRQLFEIGCDDVGLTEQVLEDEVLFVRH